MSLRLLVRCESIGIRGEVRSECDRRGITAKVVEGRRDGTVVLGCPVEQYPAVLAWWCEGSRLIRTLGPDE